MLGDVPHEEIRRVTDRGWTMRLLGALLEQDRPEEELDQVVDTLRQLEDERVVEPLRAALFDRSLAWQLRDNASSVLIACDDTVTDAELRVWWRSDDELIREHALYSMGRAQADIVLAIAGDDQHPQQAAALTAMKGSFDELRAVETVVRALRHEDADVRLAAARQLLWFDEPEAAEAPLLKATRDADDEVATAAVYALSYYRSQRVLRQLAELANEATGDVAEQVREALTSVVEAFEWSVERGNNALAIQQLRAWMAPVSDLVCWPDAIEPPEIGQPAPRDPLTAMSETAVLATINDPNVPWWQTVRTLRNTDWHAFEQPERKRLRAELTQHPSSSARYTAPFALAAWNDHDGLIALAHDPSLNVRRHTTEVIKALPPNPAYTAITWTIINSSSGLQRSNAIDAYARHAAAADAIPRLLALAQNDPSQAARLHAISALTELGARDALTDLLPLLNQPPITNWAVHTALLDAISHLQLPTPDLSNLEQIDDLYIAEALTELKLTS